MLSITLGGKKMCLLCQHAEEVQHLIVQNLYMRNVLLHWQGSAAMGSSLTAQILLLLKEFLQHVVSSCNKTWCLAPVGSLLREYHCLCLSSAFLWCLDSSWPPGISAVKLPVVLHAVLYSQSFISLNSVHSKWVQQYLLLHMRGFLSLDQGLGQLSSEWCTD